MSKETPSTRSDVVNLEGDLDRHAAEALKLEIRQLAKRYGVKVLDIRVEKDET